MEATTIRTQLQNLRTDEDAFDFFGGLGYAYGGGAPLFRDDWPPSTRTLPIARLEYIAKHHQDFFIIYCELQSERLLRTIERPILDQISRRHPFFMVVFRNQPNNMEDVTWEFVNVRVIQEVDGNSDARRTRRVARRISIGPSERQRNRLFTASQRLAIIDINHNPDISALELQNLHDQAFDVEQVTKEFYSQYVEVFHVLATDIERNNPTFAADADKQAQLLLDRLMFLYFIQKKGWLNQEFSYLYDRFDPHRDRPDDTSYFDRVIKPLFIALAMGGYGSEEVGRVPFLNGGLFQFDLHDMVMSLKISNQVFAQAFDNLFEAYAFTVEEDMPNDRSVAIDPEMLGKVFENLILTMEQEKDLRKSTGSYYTPRTVVSFMCQQSLREYLLQMWRESFRQQPVDDRLPLKTPGIGGQQEFRDVLLDQQQEEYKNRLVPFIEDDDASLLKPEDARRIRQWLLDVRVVDPAVGSGAFLVGMLQEIIRLITLLDEYTGQHDPISRNYAYKLKHDIIGHCLYGVDIQQQAVQICELRLWLSLVVDFEPQTDHRPIGEWIRDVAPLPNLSYLVRQGDSLIERVLGETVQLDMPGLSNDIRPIIEDLQERKAQYFRVTNADDKHRIDAEILAGQAELTGVLLRVKANAVRVELQRRFPPQLAGMEQELSRREQRDKQELEARIDHLKALAERADEIRRKAEGLRSPTPRVLIQLRNQLSGDERSAFIWRVDFGEVFAERGGFDIAIANPPYIRQEKIKEYKPAFKTLFPEVYNGTSDLYVYFYAQALRLLRTNGVLTFISPNKFLLAKYGKQLRQHLSKTTTIELLIDFGDLPVFEATTYPFIVITRRELPQKDNESRILNVNDMETLEALNDAARSSGKMKQTSLRADGWQMLDNTTHDLLNRLRKSGVSLLQYTEERIFIGVKTGFNTAFVIDANSRDSLISADQTSKNVIKPWLRGRDVKRWNINDQQLYVIFIPRGNDIDDYPAVKDYLSQFKQRLTPGLAGGRKAGTYKWWEIQDNVAYHEEFDKVKIVWPDIAKRCEFAIDTSGAYPDMTLFTIPTDDRFLIGILNSSVTEWFISQVSPSIQNSYLRFKRTYVSQIPIPQPTASQRRDIEAIVNEILYTDMPLSEVKQLERSLDAIVFEVFGLTDDEIDIIQHALNKQTFIKADSALSELSGLEGDF